VNEDWSELATRTQLLMTVTPCHAITSEPLEPVEGMIDTGAGITSFPEAMADELGVVLGMCKPHDVFGVGAGAWPRWPAPFELRSSGMRTWVRPLFRPANPELRPEDNARVVLGRDFMSHWKLILDIREQFVYLEPHDDVERV
jgi:hypothetical protein